MSTRLDQRGANPRAHRPASRKRPHDEAHDATRQRLLDSAGEVFAERGFEKTTVREVVSRAKANVAAVNYHFGDKRGLYNAVIRYAHACAQARIAVPSEPGRLPDAPQRLRAFIGSFLRRMYDQGRPAWHGKLISREIMQPTDALGALVEEQIRPQFQALSTIIADLSGFAVAAPQVRLCVFSIVGQCLFYHHAQEVLRRLQPQMVVDAVFIDRLAEHIAEFSLKGISAVSRPGRKGA